MLKGLAYSAYAPFPAEHTDGTYPTYEGGKFLDYDVACDLSITTRDAKFSASNRVRASDNGISGVKLSFEEGELTPTVREDLLGYFKISGTSGDPDHYLMTGDKGANVGFAWGELGEDDDGEYWDCYLAFKVSFGQTSHNAKTAGDEGVEWGTQKIEGNAMGIKPDASMKTGYCDYIRFRDSVSGSTVTTAESKAVAWIKAKLDID